MYAPSSVFAQSASVSMSAWANLARAAAWACPLRVGRDRSFVPCVLAERLPPDAWCTTAEVRLLVPSLSEKVVDRALVHLERMGAVECRGRAYRLSGELVAARLEALVETLRASSTSSDAEESDEYVCSTCSAVYSALDAASLRRDERGFFCTCGGDLKTRTPTASPTNTARAREAVKELGPLVRLCEAARAEGPCIRPDPPATASATTQNSNKRRRTKAAPARN